MNNAPVRILYKTILKLHRGLPAELQVIGDNYVRDEFKRHKNCKPAEAEVFIKEWSSYAFMVARQLRENITGKSKVFGESLTEEAINSLRDDQVKQLYDLMVETKSTTEEDQLKDSNK